MAVKITLENINAINCNDIIAETTSKSFSFSAILNYGFVYYNGNDTLEITLENVIFYKDHANVITFDRSVVLDTYFWIISKTEYNEYMNLSNPKIK